MADAKDWFTRIRETNTVEALESLQAEIEGDPEAGNALEYIKEKIGRLRAEAGRLRAEAGRLTLEALQNGTYYSRIDQVFVKDRVPTIGGKNNPEETTFYQSCCRPHCPSIQICRPTKKPKTEGQDHKSQQQNPYAITLEAANDPQNVPANEKSSSPTSTHKIGEIWKTDVFANDPGGEIAHLVPASVQHANHHWFVTDFLFGTDQDRKWNHVLKLIHGSRKGHVNGSAKTPAARTTNTGVKHMVTNKILLSGQGKYLDLKPCILFVPILTKEEALSWIGGAYEAVAMIDAFPPLCSSHEEQDQDDSINRASLQQVATLTSFIGEAKANASVPELHQATTLLRDYTRAILHARRDREPQDANLQEKIEDVTNAFFPKLCDDPDKLKVRKVQFDSNQALKGHPAPDPLLLVTKAVDVIQRRHGFRIVAAAEEEDDRSELSIQAEEEYLRWRESMTPAPNPIGLDVDIAIH